MAACPRAEKPAKSATVDAVATLHRLRIAITAALLTGLLRASSSRADVQRQLNRMKAPQADLGPLNDLAHAYSRIASCAGENRSMAEGVAFAHGCCSHQPGSLLLRIPGEIEPLAKPRRFWRG